MSFINDFDEIEMGPSLFKNIQLTENYCKQEIKGEFMQIMFGS